MIGSAILLVLQATAYGPALPKPLPPAKPVTAGMCGAPGPEGEIVVCKRRRAGTGQRIDRDLEQTDPDQRLNLKLGEKVGLKGGGPKVRSGQAVGVGISLGF